MPKISPGDDCNFRPIKFPVIAPTFPVPLSREIRIGSPCSPVRLGFISSGLIGLADRWPLISRRLSSGRLSEVSLSSLRLIDRIRVYLTCRKKLESELTSAFIHICRRSISRLSAVCRLMAQPLWQAPGHRRTSSEVGEEYGISQAY